MIRDIRTAYRETITNRYNRFMCRTTSSRRNPSHKIHCHSIHWPPVSYHTNTT